MEYGLLFTEPSFRHVIWGGDRMETELGYRLPGKDIGECLAVSQNELADSVISDGIYKGKKLSELWNSHRELFSDMEGETFPLLVKIIDAKADLSIQVHPDNEYAAKNENGMRGKTECWLVLDCDENADIIIGHNAKDKNELIRMVKEGRWDELITPKKIRKGDFFQIDAGTVHAIRKGTLILETQQNSTLTYRLYDYDRVGADGKKRELHVEKSLDVIKCPQASEDGKKAASDVGFATREVPCDAKIKRKFIDYGKVFVEELVDCPYYRVMRLAVSSECEIPFMPPFMIFACIEGAGAVCGHSVKKGDFFIAPAGKENLSLKGDITLLVSVPK